MHRQRHLWLIDPKEVVVPVNRKVEVIMEKASKGVAVLTERLLGPPTP